jgi:Outer membrane protein beta-barrel domain
MRVGVWVLAFLLGSSSAVSAEWQLKPFLGVTFGGATTFFDHEFAVGGANVVFGTTGVLLGEVFGVEGDFGYGPGFFTKEGVLVLGSRATTLTGNVVVALPRRLSEYSLRPYFVGGGGFLHVSTETSLGQLPVNSTLPVMDLGGGVTGFLSRRIGVNWDIRYFRSGSRPERPGEEKQSFGDEQLSFWRAHTALAIRF